MHLAVEVGGTSIRIATTQSTLPIFTSLEQLNDILENTKSIPFGEFEATLTLIVDYCKDTTYTSIGISSFGPICLLKNSEKYGEILVGACDVKKTWLNKSLALNLGTALGVERSNIFVETDVNGACLAEIQANKIESPSEFETIGENWSYITVGTGVGVGLVNTALMRGCFGGVAGHPEGGHIV